MGRVYDFSRVNTGIVQNHLDLIESETKKIKKLFEEIKEEYLDGAKIVWDTPTAERDVLTPVTTALNDFIDQFNTKVSRAFTDFTDEANNLFVGQGLKPVHSFIEETQKMSKNWNADPDPSKDHNVTEDFTAFTEEHLWSKIAKINTSLDQIGEDLNQAIKQGLDNEFCRSIKAEIQNLKDSAQNVLTDYGKDFIERARSNDGFIKSQKK